MHLPGHSSPLDLAKATLKVANGLSELVSAEFSDEFNHLFTYASSIVDAVGVSSYQNDYSSDDWNRSLLLLRYRVTILTVPPKKYSPKRCAIPCT
jgi:hypothetical protein